MRRNLSQEVKNIIRELFNSTPRDINVAYGYKTIKGKKTRMESIIFIVPEKKPLSELSPDEILPHEDIILSDRVLKVDVVGAQKKDDVIDLSNCVPCNQWYYNENYVVPNRQYHRPIMGGLSISSLNNLCYYGTLGFIAVDNETQALVGVTSNSAMVRDGFYSSERNLFNFVENEYNLNEIGDNVNPITHNFVYQPIDTQGLPSPDNIIGQVLRYVPLYSSNSGSGNTVDASLISLDCDVIDYSESYKQIGLTGITAPLEFATTAEIDNLLVLDPKVYFSARTVGIRQGGCTLKITALGATIQHNYMTSTYYLQNNLTDIIFEDLIEFKLYDTPYYPDDICAFPTYNGDTGAALIADFSGTLKIIGMILCGDPRGDRGYATRIDNIIEQLNISAWNGSVKPFVDTSNIEIIAISGFTAPKTYSCDGKNYWQVGTTRQDYPCS